MIQCPTASCNGYWLCFITQSRNLTLRNTAYIQDAIYQVVYVSKKKLSCQHSDIKTALRNHSQVHHPLHALWEDLLQFWDFIPSPQRCAGAEGFVLQPPTEPQWSHPKDLCHGQELSNQNKSQASLQPSNHCMLNTGRIFVSQNNTNDNDVVFFYKSN